MAKVYLDSGDSFTLGSGATVFGAAGTEKVLVGSGVSGVVVDQNVERVDLAAASSGYTYQQAGNTLQVYSGATLIASIPLQGDADGTTVAFTNGSVSAKLTAGVMTLGGATVPSAAPGPVTPTTINAGDPSGVAPTGPSFSVAGPTSVTEGSNATFTVSLSAAQSSASTVTYTLAGTGGAVLGTDTGTSTPAGNTGTLTFAAGEVTKTVVVPITFDTTAETGEGVSLTLSAPSTGVTLGTSTVTTAIADPVAPTFTLTSNAVAGGPNEEGSTITYTVTPSSITDKVYTFTLNTTGDTLGGVAAPASATDFSPAAQTITFAAGTAVAQNVAQLIVNDGVNEGLEGYKTSLLDASFAAVASKTGTITDPTSGTGSGTTFTLTTAADTFVGTNGNDNFIGLVDGTTATNSTLTAIDTLNGGLGTGDALNITTQGAGAIADAINGALVSNTEIINLRATGTGGVAMAGTNALGATLINNNLSTDGVTLTALAGTTALKITGNGAVTNGATTATYAGSATAGNLTLDGGTTAGAVAVNGAGFTSFTVNSTGATNTIGALSSSGTSIATTTINATTAFETTGLTVGTVAAGGQTLVISGAAADRAATSTSAPKSSVTLGALDADYVSVNASGLTVGGVSATLSATTTTTFTGGSGNDILTTSHSAHTGAIDAAGGTDTLVLAATADLDTKAEGALYKGFEVLKVENAVAIDMDLVTGSTITGIVLNDAGGATAVTNMSAAAGTNVRIHALDSAATLGIKDATIAATANTMNITVSDGDTTPSESITVTGDLTIAGVETITVTATDDLTLATMLNITGLTSLTVSGPGDVSIITLAHVASANEAINFSGLTTASTFNFAGTTTNAISFTGGSGVDTVTDSVIGGNVISTGAGRDVITLTAKTGGTSGDIITPGAGGDSVVATAAKGNAAIEKFTLKFAAGDSIIDSTTTGTGFVAATMDSVTGIDLATVAAAAAGHVITFDTVESATAVTFTSSAVTFGTTTVTNAFDFLVYNTGAGGISYAYQDTNGNKIIDNGEFGIQLVGVAATATTADEFAVVGGNLVLTTVAG